MDPKEKAKELVERFRWQITYGLDDHLNGLEEEARECALICVDEILKENERINKGGAFPTPLTEFWEEVKQEINN